MTQTPAIPTLSTERLMLRAPRLEDFEHWAAYFASERARFEGHGSATEAARAVRDRSFSSLGLPSRVSYVDPANSRSVARARRLVAQHERAWTTPGDKPAQTWRHPGPDSTGEQP